MGSHYGKVKICMEMEKNIFWGNSSYKNPAVISYCWSVTQFVSQNVHNGINSQKGGKGRRTLSAMCQESIALQRKLGFEVGSECYSPDTSTSHSVYGPE